MRIFNSLISLVLLLGTAVNAGTVETVDGVVHVTNTGEPDKGTEVIELEEQWRVGGDDGDMLFGLVTQVMSDDDSNIYILDTQLSEVQVLSPEGEYLQTLSRQGEGPGETQYPVDMFIMSDGTVGLVQTFPGKIIKVDREGNPAGSMTIGGGDPTQGGFVRLVDAKESAGNLVLSGERIVVNQQEGKRIGTNFLASFNEDGTEKVRYLEKENILEFANIEINEVNQYFVHFRHWALDAKGNVFTAPHRDRYAIEVFTPDGALTRVIEREFTHWTRDEKDKARINSVMDAARRQSPIEIKAEFSDTEPDITRMRIDSDDNLWVQHSRSGRELDEGILFSYDVFDPDGHYMKKVDIRCPGDPLNDGLIFAGDNRIIKVTGMVDAFIALQGGGAVEGEDEEEAEPMEVICYSIKG